MAKKSYMALDDVQDIWTNKQKPWINQQKADKSTTYTKEEVDAMKGPVYDENNRSVVFPSTSATRYDSASRSVVVAI